MTQAGTLQEVPLMDDVVGRPFGRATGDQRAPPIVRPCLLHNEPPFS